MGGYIAALFLFLFEYTKQAFFLGSATCSLSLLCSSSCCFFSSSNVWYCNCDASCNCCCWDNNVCSSSICLSFAASCSSFAASSCFNSSIISDMLFSALFSEFKTLELDWLWLIVSDWLIRNEVFRRGHFVGSVSYGVFYWSDRKGYFEWDISDGVFRIDN